MANTSTNLLSAFSRLFWMMLGPMLLVLATFRVIRTGNGWLTGADFAFLVVLFAMMGARWLEFRGGSPQTAEGQPATRTHLRRYVLGLAMVGISAWVIANVLGNYVLDS